MEQTLAERLLERFTPDELATVRAALARIEARAKATLDAHPKSSEPEKVPTPASDSVKGERDRHGRSIIARNDFAMVVECEDGDLTIASECGRFWFDGDDWDEETSPEMGIGDREECMSRLPKAAATPLPTANPAASAKVVVEPDIDAMRRAWNGVNTTTSYREDFLFGELLKLKREVAALKAVK